VLLSIYTQAAVFGLDSRLRGNDIENYSRLQGAPTEELTAGQSCGTGKA
jgi:hypothetical protein